MDPDLFLAILSMDSYNRGYEQSVNGLSESGKIGITVPVYQIHSIVFGF